MQRRHVHSTAWNCLPPSLKAPSRSVKSPQNDYHCPTPRGARWTCRLAWDRRGSASRPLLLQRFCVRQECFQQEGKNVRDLSPLLREDRLAALAAWALCAITASALSICGAGRTLPLRRRLIVHGGPVFKDHTSPRTVLVQACQHVWLVKDHDVYRKFTYVGRTHSSLAPLRLRAGRFHLASRLGVPDIRRLRCPQSFTPSRYRLHMSR
jgi:hypothetical protein